MFSEFGLGPSVPPRFEFTDSTVRALARARSGEAIALAGGPASTSPMRMHGLVPCLPEADPIVAVDAYWLHPPPDPAPCVQAFRRW